jgi:predicted nuclease of predicted toxin-antitoxin system
MKLLLDENLPHQLRHEIVGHECFTVGYMGWNGARNGELLQLAKAQNFDALLSKDANLQYEQNLVNLPISVIVLHAPSNDIEDIRPLLGEFACQVIGSFNRIIVLQIKIKRPFDVTPQATRQGPRVGLDSCRAGETIAK